ncbi:MAG: ribonuclease P protein component [Defluviitaleaceae bacterium]|nr:ribonuclease P protein component [Defluviitaleaceae bacterium]
MKFTCSVKKNRQFRQLYQDGKSFANRQLVLYVMPNGEFEPEPKPKERINRLGIVCSKKAVGKAHMRNRQRRLIRESYRLLESKIKPGYDLIFIARAGMAGMGCNQVMDCMKHILKKAAMLA